MLNNTSAPPQLVVEFELSLWYGENINNLIPDPPCFGRKNKSSTTVDTKLCNKYIWWRHTKLVHFSNG